MLIKKVLKASSLRGVVKVVFTIKWEEFIMDLIEDADIQYLTENKGNLNDVSDGAEDESGEESSGEDAILDDESIEDYLDESE